MIVVPMLAPKMTLAACMSVISPAFTKLTTMTVVTEDDCTIMVTNSPVVTPMIRLSVTAPMNRRRRSPARTWSASDIAFIPNRKMPRPPMRLKSRF